MTTDKRDETCGNCGHDDPHDILGSRQRVPECTQCDCSEDDRTIAALRAEVERLTTIIETLRNRVPTEVDHVEEMAAHNAAVAQIGGE